VVFGSLRWDDVAEHTTGGETIEAWPSCWR
jgi:hypothetical protein